MNMMKNCLKKGKRTEGAEAAGRHITMKREVQNLMLSMFERRGPKQLLCLV